MNKDIINKNIKIFRLIMIILNYNNILKIFFVGGSPLVSCKCNWVNGSDLILDLEVAI